MNVKKVALFGAITLVVLGSVIAAGCTSTTTQQTQTSDTTSCPWVGFWTSDYKHSDGTITTASMAIKADGTAQWVIVNDETWKKIGENKFTLTNPVNESTYEYTYDTANDTLTETVKGITNVHTRLIQRSDTTSSPWIGFWTSEYKRKDGSITNVSIAIKSDGTAKWAVVNDETWEKIGENKFTLTNSVTGSTYEYTYDTAKDTLKETANGITNVYTRMDPILGTWGTLSKEDEIGTEITTFFADGTGRDIMVYLNDDKSSSTFTWTKTGNNTYKLTFDTGDIWEVKIIDDDKELEWKLITLKDQILGTHTTTYEEDGEKITYATTFKDDYTGTTVGTYVNSPNKEKINGNFTWKKDGIDTYIMNFESGNKWVAIYNEDDKTIEYTYYNFSDEPIVGTHEEKVINSKIDGVIVGTYKANGDGTVVITTDKDTTSYNFLWEKFDTDLYATLYTGKNSWEYWMETYDPQTKTFESKLYGYLWMDNYRFGGKHVLDIHFTDFEEGCSWEFDGEGTKEYYDTIWEEINENTYKVTYNDGDLWTATYLPLTDTFAWKKIVQ